MQYVVVEFSTDSTTYVETVRGPFPTAEAAHEHARVNFNLDGALEEDEYGQFCDSDGLPVFSVDALTAPRA